MINKSLRFAILSILMNPLYSTMAAEIGVIKQSGFDVYVPNKLSSNEFTAGATFLRPGGSNDYAVLVFPFNPNVAAPILSPSWEPKGMNADFGAGFTLNFRHLFANSGNDINIYWAHLRTSDNDTFAVDRNPPPAQQMTGPFWNIGPDAGTTSAASGRLKNNYDVLNAEVGKNVKFDPDLKIRMFTGISALWLQQRTMANFSGTDPILGPYIFDINTKSKFNAAGMRLGIDGEYKGWCHIRPVGMLAGNVYIGSQQPSTDTVGAGSVLTAAGIPVNYQSISHDSYIQMVPALDTKLGLKYSRLYANDKSFAIEAGYKASVYINAMQNYVPSTYVPGSLGIVTGSVFLQSLIKTTDSFSVDGPYLNFSVKL